MTETKPPVIGSRDKLTDIKAAQGPLQPTAVDAGGIERIVGPAVDDTWRPAPIEPDPKQIAHLEAVNAAEEERRADRLGSTQVGSAVLNDSKPMPKKAAAAKKEDD